MPRAPRLDQRPGLAEHGVGVRHRDLGYVGQHAWPLVALAGAEIWTAPVGISADDEKIGARAFLLVADPGRNDDDIARADRDGLALIAAEADACLAFGDAEDLMRSAVIVMIRVDAVAPAAAPAVAREERLECAGRI